MKRYMWHAHFRIGANESMGVSCSDALNLVRDGIRLNATAICLHRGEEIKGKLPTLMEMRGIVKAVRGDEVEVEFKEFRVGGPKLAKDDPLNKASSKWEGTRKAVNFTGKKPPIIGWKKT